MASTIQNIVIDCADTYELGSWWAQVVGYPLADDDQPGDPEAIIVLPGGAALFFAQVSEGNCNQDVIGRLSRRSTGRDNLRDNQSSH